MEVFERRDYRVVILQENSAVQLCLYDSFHNVAFTSEMNIAGTLPPLLLMAKS